MANSKGATTKASNKVGVQHPMIPVPQALKQVLTCTATALLSSERGETDTDILVGSETLDLFPMSPNGNGHQLSSSSSSAAASPIVGRIAAETIKAPSPGYPPYRASIMDGYAISTLDIRIHQTSSSSSSHQPSQPSQPSQRFACKGRIHAGPQNSQGLDRITTAEPPLPLMASTTTAKQLPTASYVTTGAVIPSCYNAVIPLEQVILSSSNTNDADNDNGDDDDDDDNTPDTSYIDISWDVLKTTTVNKWIRPIGCDIPPNTIIVSKGDTINPIQLGLLIQCSISTIHVRCLPKVSLVSTGNELVSCSSSSASACSNTSSTNLPHGQIPDVNRPILHSILSGYKSNTITDYGIQSDDDADQLERTLNVAVEQSHVVITTGGISMGEKDIVEQVLVERLDCSIQFGRLCMKPGKPTTFGTIRKSNGGTCLIFCLPGNPVSACVCLELLVRPCLDMLHCGLVAVGTTTNPSTAAVLAVGQSPSQSVVTKSIGNAKVLHSEVLATLGKSVKLDVERPEYCRVQLTYRINTEGHGEYVALSTGIQRSSRLMSMSGADGLMVLPKGIRGEKEFAEAGEKYLVLLLRKEGGGAAGVHNAITLHDSLHLKKAPFTIAILQVIGDNKDLHQRTSDSDVDVEGKIRDAMDPNNFRVIQKVDVHHKDFASDILLKSSFLKCMDVIMVVCTNTGFQVDLEIASTIRSCIVKEADAMSYQMRKGASLDKPVSVLFDPVVGHLPLNGATPLLLSMSDEGMDGALNNVKVLLKRALITAQK